jgi:hypothetical protein
MIIAGQRKLYIKDEFGKLLAAIKLMGDQRRANELFGFAAQLISQRMFIELEKVQPDGSETYHPTRGSEERPSVRHGYTPIASGWEPPNVLFTDKGVRLVLTSKSEHIDVQRFGTKKKNYSIPHGELGVAFWWGTPLPWSPTKTANAVRAPGPFWFKQIVHPGIEPYGGKDFVARAWRSCSHYAFARFREVGFMLLGPLEKILK